MSASSFAPLQKHCSRCSAISQFPRPVNPPSLQHFLGMINFYRKFIHLRYQIPLLEVPRRLVHTVLSAPISLPSPPAENLHATLHSTISFTLFTDRKPLTHALFMVSPPWLARQLSFILEFTSSIQQLPDSENTVADGVSVVAAPGSCPESSVSLILSNSSGSPALS